MNTNDENKLKNHRKWHSSASSPGIRVQCLSGNISHLRVTTRTMTGREGEGEKGEGRRKGEGSEGGGEGGGV